MILIAGVLDGIDGRIARLLRGESRFGAELDSLSDVIAFGVAPALILYLWSLQDAAAVRLDRARWCYAVFCALRLARFNAADRRDRAAAQIGRLPDRRSGAGGAGLAMLPIFLWFWTGEPLFRSPYAGRALGRVGRVADGLEPRDLFVVVAPAAPQRSGSRRWRCVVLLGAALVSAPWHTLSVVCVGLSG